MTIDLEELQKKQAAELLADAAVEEVTTAFLIVQDSNGQWAAYADYADKDLSMDRQATLDDIIGGCENVKIGAQTQQTKHPLNRLLDPARMERNKQERPALSLHWRTDSEAVV